MEGRGVSTDPGSHRIGAARGVLRTMVTNDGV